MNKKGFTLVELLGVIIMIGALILVVATPIVSQINKQKVNSHRNVLSFTEISGKELEHLPYPLCSL